MREIKFFKKENFNIIMKILGKKGGDYKEDFYFGLLLIWVFIMILNLMWRRMEFWLKF